MASVSEPESGTADEQKASVKSSSTGDRPRKKKRKGPKLPIPKTEEEIDSPTKQTVGMLGVLGVLTVVCWAFARGGCNYHPPKETRVPRAVTTEELARDPKNAAIELQQRWLTRDFVGALELASGDVAQQVAQDKAACDASCLAQSKSLRDKVLTSAVILDANLMGAIARVTSVGLPEGKKVYLLRMERAESIWKATARKADDGTPLPALPSSPHDAMLSPFNASPATPAASASAAAPGASARIAPAVSAVPRLPSATSATPRAPVAPSPAASK